MNTALWPTQTIGDLFEIGAGKTMSAKAREGQDRKPFLRTSNVLWDEIDLSVVDEMAITDEELRSKSLAPGDLLVCEGGDIGRAAIWTGQREIMSYQNHLHRLRPKTKLTDSRFYVYFLHCGFTQLGIFEGAGNKTTIPNLSKNRLAVLEVPVPPLREQQAITLLLGTVRSGVKAHAHAHQLAQELKAATMTELFTRGLRGEAQKETEIGWVPESWKIVRLGDLGRIGNGSTPKRSIPAYWTDGTYPWLTSAKMYDRDIIRADQFVTATALAECHLPKVQPGALLMAITGQGKTLGHCAVLRVEATVSQHVAYVQTDATRANPGFVRGYLETQYDYLRQIGAGGGSTKGALTCAFLRSLPIPIPSLQEQNEMVEVLDAIDRKIALHQQKRAVLEALFKALLHKLMTGEIDVNDLDLTALTALSTEPEGSCA